MNNDADDLGKNIWISKTIGKEIYMNDAGFLWSQKCRSVTIAYFKVSARFRGVCGVSIWTRQNMVKAI